MRKAREMAMVADGVVTLNSDACDITAFGVECLCQYIKDVGEVSIVTPENMEEWENLCERLDLNPEMTERIYTLKDIDHCDGAFHFR